MRKMNSALPTELLSRIFRIAGAACPETVLSCLLTCKAWSKVPISWKDRCLLRFQLTKTRPLLDVCLYNPDYTHEEVHALNTSLYEIWVRTYAAFLTSEFSWLKSMQQDLMDEGQMTKAYPQAPKDDQDWKRLFLELDFLQYPFRFIRTYRLDGDEDDPAAYWDQSPGEGAMACPLLLSPMAVLEDPSICDCDLVEAVLGPLGVDRRLYPYYYVDRVSFNEKDQCSELLMKLRRGLLHIDDDADPEYIDEDYDIAAEWWLAHAHVLRARCVAFGFEELIHIGVRDNYDDNHTNDGWCGSMCHVALCRHRDANQRVLGWIMYYNYNP
ncbi:hypothetical protein BC832DRAFT_591763 [Gaertneriomyces semiglobifer]|nr:hypothetical protein BC832DRAFT_591763 [Gaertneriomyces semiglobifer]